MSDAELSRHLYDHLSQEIDVNQLTLELIILHFYVYDLLDGLLE